MEMDNVKIENFILEYSGFIGSDFCEEAIQYFQNMKAAGFVDTRVSLEGRAKHLVDDSNTGFHGDSSIKLNYVQNISSVFLNLFWNTAYKMYAEKYSILSSIEEHKIYALKLQNIKIGEGYHIWHFENSSRNNQGRILTFILYLNDVEEGGETELLYYPKRIKAEQGKLILFPGTFTHTHRGNPPISNEKYIITGWVEF